MPPSDGPSPDWLSGGPAPVAVVGPRTSLSAGDELSWKFSKTETVTPRSTTVVSLVCLQSNRGTGVSGKQGTRQRISGRIPAKTKGRHRSGAAPRIGAYTGSHGERSREAVKEEWAFVRLTLGKACRIISLVRLEPKFSSSSKQQPVGASGRGPNDPAATCATALSELNVLQNTHEGGKRTFSFIKSRTMVGERTSSKGWTTTDVRPTIGGSSGQSSSASPSSSRTRVSTSILSMSVALDGPPLARGPIS